MNNKVSKEILRLQKIAGIIKESWDDDEQDDKFDDYGRKKNTQSNFDPFGNQDFLDYDDDDFEKAVKGGKPKRGGIENEEDPYDFSDYGIDTAKDSEDKKSDDDIEGSGRSTDKEKDKKDDEELVGDPDLDDFLAGTGFDFKLSKKEMDALNSGDRSKKGEFTLGGNDDRMGFSGNLDDYISNFLPSLKKDKEADIADRKEKEAAAKKDREERNVRIDRRTGEEKTKRQTTSGTNQKSKRQREKEKSNTDVKKEYSLYEIYLKEVGEEVDFLDLKTGQDVWVKSKKGWAVITDLEGPSSDDAGENTFIIVKLRNGEEIEVPLSDIEIDDSTDDGNGDHYGDEEDDLSYYTRRGWKSSMEEDQDPSEKMDKLVGLGEGKESEFEMFMKSMMGLHKLSQSGFITPEEWKEIFPIYTDIYSRAKQMDVKHFQNDK